MARAFSVLSVLIPCVLVPTHHDDHHHDQNHPHVDFAVTPPAPTPNKLGVTVLDKYSIEDVIPYIDWNPFFQTWELRGVCGGVFFLLQRR